MYRPMVEMETTAENATLLCSMGRPRMKENVVMALPVSQRNSHGSP